MIEEFGDSADWRNIPEGWRAILPVDGEFAAPRTAVTRFSHVRWYTVTGDYRHAGAVDWEPGNPCYTPGGLRRYIRGRRSMNARARVYLDRADASEAIAALRDYGHGELLSYPGLLWWIATLDGKRHTPAGLAAELAAGWDAPIPEAQIWADQYVTMTVAGPLTGMPRQERLAAARTGAYDVSDLYGEW